MHLQLLFHRARWLHLPATLLVMLLQRTPVLRVLAVDGPGFALRSADILKSAFALAALGAYNSVTGATTFNSTATSPTTASPASAAARATVNVGGAAGSAFNLAINVTGAPSTCKSWKVTGTLPSGITVSGGTASGSAVIYNGLKLTLAGTPASAASGNVTVTAYDSTNASGNNTSITCAFAITGSTATAPAFSQHPASQTVTTGDNVTFTATVNGTPAPTLQWYKDGQPISGKTSATLSLTKVQLADAGSYKLVATNSAAPSGVSSNTATLTVNEPPPVAPVFATQPLSQTIVAGSAVVFTTVVTGKPAPALQWYKDGQALAGKTSATLALGTVQPSDAGDYAVVATNAAAPAGVTSDVAKLTVNYAPAFSVSPESQTVALGSTVILSSAASGLPAPAFVWRKDGVILAGQTGPELTISPVAFTDAGRYVVTAANSVSTVSAAAATLSVIVPAPAALPAVDSLRAGSEIFWDLSGGAPVPAGLVYKAAGLPAGLKLDSATGHITGIITAAGSFKVSTWAAVGSAKSVVNNSTFAVGAFPAELVGAYEALLHADDQAALPVGKVSLKVAANGTFTGTLLAEDLAAFPLSGRLALAADNASGSASLSRSRGKILPAYLLNISVSNSSPALSAALYAGPTAVGLSTDGARLLAAAPAGAAGPYTLLLSTPTNFGVVTDHPLGDGHATATLAATGKLTLAGKNADGSKLTGTFPMGADHAYRVYAKPYSAQIGGYVSGTLPLAPRADNPARWHLASEAGHDVYWRKPDPLATTTNYADGFGPLGLSARLEPWTKLSSTTTLAPLLGLGSSGDLAVTIAATGLANDDADPYGLPKLLALSSANTLSVVGDNRSALFTAKVNAATGALSGAFTLQAIPPVAKRSFAYSGVLLQTAPADQPGLVGGGFFLLPAASKGGPVLSGKVEFATP